MKIIGSTAAKYWGLLNREPKDNDLVFEAGTAIPPYAGLDVKELPFNIYDRLWQVDNYVIPDHLYTIKMSHIYWDVKWSKHMQDILVMRAKGCKVDEELYMMLYNYWCTIHGTKDFLSLKKTKDEFFNDNVPYIYDHDYLHDLVCYYDKPLYKQVLKEGENVLIDQRKYLTLLSEDDRLRMIREEAYVIALERWLIPSGFKIPRVKAYNMALKKMVTNLTKGWFARYVVDNYHNLWKLDDHNWVQLFKERNKEHDRFYSR